MQARVCARKHTRVHRNRRGFAFVLFLQAHSVGLAVGEATCSTSSVAHPVAGTARLLQS